MSESKVKDILKTISDILSCNDEQDIRLVNFLEKKKLILPSNIQALLKKKYDEVCKIIPFAFLGYELLDEEKIIEQYKTSDISKGFFAAYGCSDSFILSENISI